MTRLTCLIPAWNEAARLHGVLGAVRGHPLLDRVLVVDDGSTDGTADVARAMGVEVLALPANGGKTAALAAGIAALEGGYALLLDADLIGLTQDAVTALAEPVLSGQAGASLSLRGNAPGLWRAIGVDYISGERVLPVALLKAVVPELATLPRFGFEVFLNRQLKAQGYIVNANCYLDPELNGLESLQAGKLWLDYDYTPVPPLEQLGFNARITNQYLIELLPAAA